MYPFGAAFEETRYTVTSPSISPTETQTVVTSLWQAKYLTWEMSLDCQLYPYIRPHCQLQYGSPVAHVSGYVQKHDCRNDHITVLMWYT